MAGLGKKTFSDAAGTHYKMSNPQTLSKKILNLREAGGQTRIVVGLIIPTFLRRSEFKLSTIFYIMVLCYYKNTYVSIKGRIFISVSFTRSRRGTSWILLKYKIC